MLEKILSIQLEQFILIGNKPFTMYLLVVMAFLFLFLLLAFVNRAAFIGLSIRKITKYFSEKAILNNKFLKEEWEQYASTFILDNKKRHKTTRDARDYFNSERILTRRINVRWWKFIPHIFFVVGLVAVFSQLVYGVVLFNYSSQEAVMDSMNNFFGALANGIIVLCIGLVFTVFMSFVIRVMLGRLHYRVNNLAAHLNHIYKITAMEEREISLHEYGRVLKEVGFSLLTAPESGKALPVGIIAGRLLTRMDKQGEALDTLHKALTNGSGHLTKSDMSSMMEKFGELTKQMNQTFAASMEQSTNRIVTGLEETTKELKQLADKLENGRN